MNFKVMTLFPEVIEPYVSSSIIGRAKSSGKISVDLYNIRDYSKDKHRKVDDTPYGGGFGMVMTPQPIIDCYNDITKNLSGKTLTLYMSPAGEMFSHEKALEYKEYENIVILCGHYEGVDQRALDEIGAREVSVGDYVLTGGELPAAIVIDAVSRLIDGVLPDGECYTNESIASGLLEYPQYTKPADYNGKKVPEVLKNGNHKDICKWQRQEALKKTFKCRPSLLDSANLTKDDILYLETLS